MFILLLPGDSQGWTKSPSSPSNAHLSEEVASRNTGFAIYGSNSEVVPVKIKFLGMGQENTALTELDSATPSLIPTRGQWNSNKYCDSLLAPSSFIQ